MRKVIFRKKKLSIQTIGRSRFYLGVIIGLISAVLLSLFFNHTRETFRYFTGSIADLLILNTQEIIFYNYVSALLSSSLGLTISIAIWMTNRNHTKQKNKLYKRQAITTNLFIFWLALMMITRIGYAISVSLIGLRGYDNELNLYDNYWYLFLLIPSFIFLQSWLVVLRIYRVKKWMLISFFNCLLISIIISKTTDVKQDKINSIYHKKYKKDYKYIVQELNKAKNNYGIEYSNKTIETLKKWHTVSARKQVNSLQKAFSRTKAVSLDTIILQKIMIHNYKQKTRNFSGGRLLKNWDYALPKDILKQLDFYDVDSNETKELFKILKEEINLINTREIKLDEYKYYTETERKKSFGVTYHTSKEIKNQLIIIRDSLIHIKSYSKLRKLLPKIATND